MWTLLSEADRAIGRLDGTTEIIPNPDLFVAMYVRKEAVLSSQIEGTQASLTDLLEYEIKKRRLSRATDVGDVVNYVAAMNHGLAQLREHPVSLELLKQLHAKLLTGVRGGTRMPGEFRRSQVWLGPEGTPVTAAVYVPPPPEEVMAAMQGLAEFIHRPGPLPPLVKIGLVHAQFETIHPFMDGNGRIGRLLIALLLCGNGIIRKPLFYPSHYFKRYRAEYYDRLQATRDPGEWEGWLKFFLRGVSSAADEAANTARKIVLLREQHRGLLQAELGQRTAIGLKLLERLYLNPIVDVRLVTSVTGQSYANGNTLVADFVRLGLLREKTGHKRNRRFSYQPYLDLFEDTSSEPSQVK
jgi:Fic family protein